MPKLAQTSGGSPSSWPEQSSNWTERFVALYGSESTALDALGFALRHPAVGVMDQARHHGSPPQSHT